MFNVCDLMEQNQSNVAVFSYGVKRTSLYVKLVKTRSQYHVFV